MANYTSLDDIVDKACQADFPKKAKVFKVKSRQKEKPEGDRVAAVGSSSKDKHSVDQQFDDSFELECKFLSIKVKQQDYLDVPTIAIYMSEYTLEIKEMLTRVQHREQF